MSEQQFQKVPVKVTRIFRETQKAKALVVVNEGGARSSKSFSLCQHFIFNKLLKIKGYKLLILRKVRHSLKLSTYKMFISILKMYDIYKEKNHNKTDLTYSFPEMDSEVQFGGMEDREKIKSTGWSDIWLEESNEFERDDLTFCKTRINESDDSRIYLSYNPEECWIQELEGKKNVKFIFSNYKDNPFLSSHYINVLKGLKDEDESYYRIYTLGQRAKRGILIYEPYTMEDVYPEIFEDEWYGLDFGYNNPCALGWFGMENINKRDVYLLEKIYQTKLTTPELIDLMKDVIPKEKRDKPIYADSEDPNAIKQIYDAGFNIIGAEKKKGSVYEGIIFTKRYIYHTCKENVNANKERTTYKWKVDRNGKLIDEPVKFRDHFMNCKRYGIYMHNGIIKGNPTTVAEALKEVEKNMRDAEDLESAGVNEGVYLTE